MKFSIFKMLALFCCFSTLCLYADEEVQEGSTTTQIPNTVTFEHNGRQYTLEKTGEATRKKFFVKVYAIASYMQKDQNSGGDIFQEIMQDNKVKQLTMKWLHEATVDKVQNGYVDSFRKALSPTQMNQMQNEINTFIHFFNQEVKVGDEHILRWIPGGYIEVLINGNKVGNIKNLDFAKGLWSIWFGQNSVVDRNQLVSLMK